MKLQKAILTFLLFAAFQVRAEILIVPGDYPTIQAGIDASMEGDTVLVAPGTYFETINFNGHNAYLASHYLISGDTSYIVSTIINANGTGHAITLENYEDNAVIKGFTIRGGTAQWGGGIYCVNSSPFILRNFIKSNYMLGDYSFGGGICCKNGSAANIARNRIEGNRAGYGGGIAVSGSNPIIEDNEFIGNTATNSEIGGMGAGIYCEGTSAPIIRRNFFSQDTAQWSGGGINLNGITQALVENNTIQDCIGGGIVIANCYSVIKNNVIANNTHNSMGGGIICYDFTGVIGNNIISDNTAVEGGAIFSFSESDSSIFLAQNVVYNNSSGLKINGGSAILLNSIFWNNDSYSISASFSADLAVSWCDIEDGWTGEGNINTDPLFVDPDSGNFHLMSTVCGDAFNSPCIDSGHPDSLDSFLSCEQGLGSERADMGAYGGGGAMTDIEDEIEKASVFSLNLVNYPNPFNASTVISFSLAEPTDVVIEIFDILGKRVDSIFLRWQTSGNHSVLWDASGFSSGIYFSSLKVDHNVSTRQMLLLK